MTVKVIKKIRVPQQARSKEKVNRITSAARTLFSKEGYTKTTMSRIAGKAGVSTGTAYAYFPDKSEILRRILQDHVEEILQPAEKIMQEIPKNAEVKTVLRKLINCFTEVHKKNAGLQILFHERIMNDKKFRALVMQYRNRGREIGRQLVKRFGNLKTKKNNEAEAQVIVGLLDFCTHIGTVFPSDVTIEDACQVGVNMIGAYLSPRSAPRMRGGKVGRSEGQESLNN